MSCSPIRSSKLAKVFIEPESVCSTYEPITADSFMVPIVSNTRPTPDRGSRLIDRTNTMDGQAGDIVSVAGTYGWSYTMEAELQIPADPGPDFATIGYWGAMLLASGYQLSVTTEAVVTPVAGDWDVYEYTLSTIPFDDYVGGDGQGPAPSSITFVQNSNGTSDYAMRLRGCTGVTSFSFTAGEIATISTTFKGLVVPGTTDTDDLLYTEDVDISLLGTAYNLNVPIVVKSITLSVTNNTTTNPVLISDLASFELNTNSNHPDVQDPTKEFGLALSPVYHDASPTISFTFMDTDAVDDEIFAALRVGTNFEIVIELVSTSNSNNQPRFIRFTMPRAEFTDVSMADSSGMNSYNVNGKLVRLPGDTAESLLSVAYFHTFTPA